MGGGGSERGQDRSSDPDKLQAREGHPGEPGSGGGTPLSCWGLVRGQHGRQPRMECSTGLRGVPEQRPCPQGLRPAETPGEGAPSTLRDERREPLPPATHLVTTAILTPKTPVCFREGILFKLNSLLVNLIDSFTSIWRGGWGARPSQPPGPQSLLPGPRDLRLRSRSGAGSGPTQWQLRTAKAV